MTCCLQQRHAMAWLLDPLLARINNPPAPFPDISGKYPIGVKRAENSFSFYPTIYQFFSQVTPYKTPDTILQTCAIHLSGSSSLESQNLLPALSYPHMSPVHHPATSAPTSYVTQNHSPQEAHPPRSVPAARCLQTPEDFPDGYYRCCKSHTGEPEVHALLQATQSFSDDTP